jgi:hypothetical protein
MFSSVSYAVELLNKLSCVSEPGIPKAFQLILDGNKSEEWDHGFGETNEEYRSVVHDFGRSLHAMDLMGVTSTLVTFGDLMDAYYSFHLLGEIFKKQNHIKCSTYDEFPAQALREALFEEEKLCRGR